MQWRNDRGGSGRATLTGDRGALERFYTLELSGSAEQWQLVLTPNQPRMAQIISQIRIGGVQALVKTIEFQQADGDRLKTLARNVIVRPKPRSTKTARAVPRAGRCPEA